SPVLHPKLGGASRPRQLKGTRAGLVDVASTPSAAAQGNPTGREGLDIGRPSHDAKFCAGETASREWPDERRMGTTGLAQSKRRTYAMREGTPAHIRADVHDRPRAQLPRC